MSALRAIASFLAGAPARHEGAASALGRVTRPSALRFAPQQIVPVGWANRPRWPSFSSNAAITRGLRSSTWVYVCVWHNAKALGSVPWRVYTRKTTSDRQWVEASAHPLQRLLDRPNHFYGARSLTMRVSMELDLTGNSLISMLRLNPDQPRTSVPLELWTVRPNDIAPVLSTTETVSKYVVTTADGKDKQIAAHNVVHVQLPNPDAVHWGLSPMQAAARTVDTDIEAASFQKASLQNMMIPPGAFVFKGHISEAQFEDERTRLSEQYQGAINARQPLLLGGGGGEYSGGGGEVQWVSMALTPQEVDFIETRRMTREEICSVYGTPPPCVGILDRATYNNIKTAKEMWWEDTLAPRMELVADYLNARLVPNFGDPDLLKVAPDFSGIDAMLARIERRIAIAERLHTRGMSWNQAQAYVGLDMPMDEGGDIAFVPASSVPVADLGLDPMDDMAVEPVVPSGGLPAVEDDEALDLPAAPALDSDGASQASTGSDMEMVTLT